MTVSLKAIVCISCTSRPLAQNAWELPPAVSVGLIVAQFIESEKTGASFTSFTVTVIDTAAEPPFFESVAVASNVT